MDLPTCPAVVLTREHDDNRELAQALAARGVPVVEVPCLATRLVAPGALPAGPFAAVTFTSRRGVRGALLHAALGQHLQAAGRPLVAAVGDATAAALREADIAVDLVAEPPEGSVLAQLLLARLASASSVLLIRGNIQRGELAQALREAGHSVVELTTYQNYSPEIPLLDAFPVAAVFVASPSAVRRLVEKNPWLVNQPFCAIGPTTAEAARQSGARRVFEIGAEPAGWADALFERHRSALAAEEP